MIYFIWHQHYDYAGASLVEGPADADFKTLRKEHHKGWMKQMQSDVDEENPFVRPYPHESIPFVAHEDDFVYWLVKDKGFSIPEHKRIEF